MDVRLPNGKIVSNIPEGITKADLQEKLIRNGLATPEDFATAPQPSRMDKTLGAIETGASILSGMVAEPVAGLAGIAASATPFLRQGIGADVVQDVRQGMTYQPRTEMGQQYQQGIGEALAPVGEAMQGAEQYLGDKTFDLTGSPTLAAAAQTIPTLGMELAGVGAGKVLTKAGQAKNINKAITESAPSVEQLKQASRGIYKELDDTGAGVNENAFNNLAISIHQTAKDLGHHPKITPKVQGVLDTFAEDVGKAHSISDIETLRKVANNAASSLDPAEKMIGVAMIDNIDDFFDSLKPADLIGDSTIAPEKVGGMYRQARDLWGRQRRSELINKAIEDADLQASGTENGIRIAFRQILKNKKQNKFFSEQEKAEMRRVVEGSKGANIAKLIGKFGISENQATNVLGASLGAGGGAAAGSFLMGTGGAGAGAVIVPLVGTVSKKLAQNLTNKNARFADDVIRAGKDSKKIAEAYLKYTPKAEQSAQELTELFIAKKVPTGELQKLQQSKVKPIADAAIFATPVIKQIEEEQEEPQGLTIDVQQGFQDKQVEPAQPDTNVPEVPQKPYQQGIDPMGMTQQSDDFRLANEAIDHFGNEMISSYKVDASPRISAIDLDEIQSHPKEIGMQLLSELYADKPAYIPIVEKFIEADTKPEYAPVLQSIGNVLRNSGIMPPDDKEASIAKMVAMGIEPQKAFNIANTIKTIRPQEAKKIADSVRNKISPEMYADFAPLISSIEALA